MRIPAELARRHGRLSGHRCRLAQLVRDRKVRSDAVILARHEKDARAFIAGTADRLGRKGTGWTGGVGVLVSMFSPRLLAPVVSGAAASAVLAALAKTKIESGIEMGLAEKIKPGTAVILAIIEEADKLAAEQAMAGSPANSVADIEGGGLGGLKKALAEAAGKFNPNRSVLPIPDRKFGGTIGRTLDKSVGDWLMLAGPQAPEDAPNVLIVLIDDAGFGGPSTFGGGIETPNLTRVQNMGLAFNRFHVTAACFPTRAAMLTGRNHHRVGMGTIAELPAPYPGYTGMGPRTCTALPRILRENGYVMGGFGKWHLTPGHEMGAAGPFDHGPQSWGFDKWWGFLTGAAGQYDPIITQDNSTLGVPEGKDGKLYYFPDDITDKAVEWLHAVRAHNTQKPWMLYYSTGCSHAPHHVGKEWADKYKRKFDQGWDKYREETLARQKKLGIGAPDTELSARPDLFPAWDSLSDAQKKLYARQMEVFADYSENADWNVGRLLDAIEEMGERDNIHLGRQRLQHGRDAHRFLQRDDVLQRGRSRCRPAARPDREIRRHRGTGRLPYRAALRRGLGAR
jgi:hypothetical protein